MEAAHFCYLMAHVPFGHYTVKTDHLALLGSSHRYVMLWGKEAGRTFSRGLFEPLLGFMAPFSIFLCEFHLLLLLSSGGLFCKGPGREVPSGCCITPTGGFRPQSCSPKLCLCSFGVYCAPLTTGWHPGSMSGGHLVHQGEGGLGLCARQPWAWLRVSPGQNWKLEEVYAYSLHPYTDLVHKLLKVPCYLFYFLIFYILFLFLFILHSHFICTVSFNHYRL